MLVERHIFGSRTGYTTLARSSGLSDRDCRELESGSFAFGQTADRAYLDSLATQPAFFTRVLAGGRGITRVFKGSPDESNRPTLLMITAVVSQLHWDQNLQGDIEQLLAARDLWKPASGPVVSAVEVIPTPPRVAVELCQSPRILALISATEEAGQTGRPAVLAEGDCSRAEIAALELLMPRQARRSCTTAYRSLSPSLPVSVNVLASQASQQKISRRLNDSSAISGYARQLQTAALSTGQVPVEVIARGSFSAAKPAAAVAPAMRPASPAGPIAGPPKVSRPVPPVTDYDKPIAWWVVAAIPTGVLIVGISIFWFARRNLEQPVLPANPVVIVRPAPVAASTTIPAAVPTTNPIKPITPEQVKAAFQGGLDRIDDVMKFAKDKIKPATNPNKTGRGNNHNAAANHQRNCKSHESGT